MRFDKTKLLTLYRQCIGTMSWPNVSFWPEIDNVQNWLMQHAKCVKQINKKGGIYTFNLPIPEVDLTSRKLYLFLPSDTPKGFIIGRHQSNGM